MEAIFHEKQEGSLCAQHCLNSLLQGPYFTAVDLSILAQKLDEEERVRMAECGIDSEDYRNFLKQPSGNMDDSGYFSVQVISSALQVWGLELVPYSSSDERVKSQDPTVMNAFICNYQNHWFTIRKIGNQWFNLNSLLNKPVLISDTYLSLFLAQLRNEGYAIFAVFGDLPECSADEIIRRNPVAPPLRPTTHHNPVSVGESTAAAAAEDPDLQAALEASLLFENRTERRRHHQQPADVASSSSNTSEEDEELQRALMQSLLTNNNGDKERTQVMTSSPPAASNQVQVQEEDDEKTMLHKAMLLSME